MYAASSKTTSGNEHYQKEIVQCPRYCQLIAMCLLPNEEVPMTKDPNICKLIHVFSGTGVLYVQKDQNSKSRKRLLPGMSVMIFPGSSHRIRNNGEEPLKMMINNTPPKQEFQNIRRPAINSGSVPVHQEAPTKETSSKSLRSKKDDDNRVPHRERDPASSKNTKSRRRSHDKMEHHVGESEASVPSRQP